MASGARVCLGQIGAPHGVRGEVRLRSFTGEPEAIAGYGALETDDGRTLQIESLRPAKDCFVATIAGIRSRDAAEQLTNAKLYVPRERLPALEGADEFYHADLIGLAAVDRSGRRLGTVVAIHNFGAGDLIELQLDDKNKTELIAFDEYNVPEIDIGGGKIVIEPASLADANPPLRGGDQ
ncbi:MAG TPA: ribosome maturation factor RimM [Xanthobacteraceae bacterium]|nr:ribosome maturation factor RimM [Xanthobacteraceae bacterium]